MHKRRYIATVVLLSSLFAVQIALSNEASIGSRLHWPPVFERAFGEPRVSVVRKRFKVPTKVIHIRATNTVIVRAHSSVTDAEINYALRRKFLAMVWDRFLDKESQLENETRLSMTELIPMSKNLFFSSGNRWLSGQSTGDEVLDCWWKVRCGENLTLSRNYLLGFTTLLWDDPDKKSWGHYAFCLRQRGGHPDRDIMFDFRAPWKEDRRPRSTEGLNLHNKLKIAAMRENLYDWVYTQTHFRNCNVRMRFVPVHVEQVKLLQAFNGRMEGGNFRALRKNCASMGTFFTNRILPLDMGASSDAGIADLPLVASDNSVRVFSLGKVVADASIDNQTVTPTNKTEIHQAPSRVGSRGYQFLRGIPEIN